LLIAFCPHTILQIQEGRFPENAVIYGPDPARLFDHKQVPRIISPMRQKQGLLQAMRRNGDEFDPGSRKSVGGIRHNHHRAN
jgi:hypothetical protein